MRDDFSARIKDTLARRVGFRCSLPDCRATTSGPHSDPEKVVNVGVACHITAASEGGPRYDAGLSAEQRAAVENGIWLCQTHAKLIDNDMERYTVTVLHQWKATAEEMIRQELEAANHQSRDVIATSGRLTAILVEATAHFDRLTDAHAQELPSEAAEVARQLEHRINDVVKDALELKANPLFDAADRLETAIAVKSMRAALRLRGFQYHYARLVYDEDIFRAYIDATQNEYGLNSVDEARRVFVDALDGFERVTWLRTLRRKVA